MLSICERVTDCKHNFSVLFPFPALFDAILLLFLPKYICLIFCSNLLSRRKAQYIVLFSHPPYNLFLLKPFKSKKVEKRVFKNANKIKTFYFCIFPVIARSSPVSLHLLAPQFTRRWGKIPQQRKI